MSSSAGETDHGGARQLGESDPALLRALADPASYGCAVVTVHETHASWVFVADERAYKIKKPVVLGFLDYGTLASRRAACIEEVRINRALAPDVYVGVREIVRTATGYAFASPEEETEGRVVEYAVEMRSFDEADTLAGLIRSQTLTSVHLVAVAHRLAAFHRDAPAAAGGSPRQVLEMWQQNLGALESAEPLALPVDALQHFAEMFVTVHAREIERRVRAGLIRDGHGDLRCDHVLVLPSVRVVDRIEFDASLRRGDIARDVAFLTMDLEAHGQRWAAEELLAAYRGCGMDAGSDALLAFYGAHWALVRAKVALISAAETDDERGAALVEKARSRSVLSETLCWRARGPVALVICGTSATGKSTLAAELARRSGLEVLSSDAIRKAAVGLPPTGRGAPEHYSLQVTHRVYELLGIRAVDLLDRHAGVIVDATCRSRAERSTLLGRIDRTGVPRLVVRCSVPLEIALQRARRRTSDPERVSDAGAQIVADQHHSFEPLEELAPRDVLELDTRLALGMQAAAVTRALDCLQSVRAGAPLGGLA